MEHFRDMYFPIFKIFLSKFIEQFTKQLKYHQMKISGDTGLMLNWIKIGPTFWSTVMCTEIWIKPFFVKTTVFSSGEGLKWIFGWTSKIAKIYTCDYVYTRNTKTQ